MDDDAYEAALRHLNRCKLPPEYCPQCRRAQIEWAHRNPRTPGGGRAAP